MTATHATSRRLSGRHVLLALLGFFAVIVAADSTLIYKAISTFGGLDNANAYREGLAYNLRIATSAEQSELGWRDTIKVVPGPVRLRVSLEDREGAPVTGMKLIAHIGRPATDRFDTRLDLTETEPGHYETALKSAGDGTWIVDVHAFKDEAGKPLYQSRRRLWIAP